MSPELLETYNLRGCEWGYLWGKLAIRKILGIRGNVTCVAAQIISNIHCI